MKPKLSLKVTIDAAMAALLLLLMTYERIWQATHEWLGVGMLVLLVLHHILSRKWSKALFKGKYTLLRVLQTALVAAVLLCMLGSMVSGVMLSRYAFASANRRRALFCENAAHAVGILGVCIYELTPWISLGNDDGNCKKAI